MASVNYQLLTWDGAKQKRVNSESIEIKLGKLELGVFTDVEAALSQEIADRQAAVAQEIADRQAAVSAEQAARLAADSALSGRLDIIEGSGEGSVAKAKADALSYTDTKIADLVDSAPAVLDTLKELSTALGDDPNFATTITNSLAATQAEVDAEEIRAAAAEANLQSQIDVHEGRLDVMDTIDTTQQLAFFENNAGVYADARPAIQDAAHREGWYFQNEGPVGSALNKVNWYFFDGMTEAEKLGDFGAYTIVTFDSLVSKPHLAVYTKATGSGDAGSWYKSRVVYIANETPIAGVKYLMYFGQDPKVHPELPRLTMSSDNVSTVGTQDANEDVLTAVLGSDGGTAIGNCKFVAEAVGVFTPSIKRKIALKIRKASVADLESANASLTAALAAETARAQAAEAAELARAQAAEAVLQSNIDTLEVKVDNLKFVELVASEAIQAAQVCYIKPDGQVAIAAASLDLSDAQLLLAVEGISSGATGKFVIVEGTILSGFSSLTPGKKYFVSGTAGGIVDSTSAFVAGYSVCSVGRAISATELAFAPVYEFEY